MGDETRKRSGNRADSGSERLTESDGVYWPAVVHYQRILRRLHKQGQQSEELAATEGETDAR